MKRWSTDRRGWWRLRRSRSRVVRHEDAVLVRLEAVEVVEPLWVICAGEHVKILDDGYAWLFICPEGARHVVTAHFDERGQPVHWYIDVVERWTLGDDGFPVYDDLFLDVIALPSGRTEVLDGDELEAASAEGGVTAVQRVSAWEEAERIRAAIRSGTFEPVARCTELLEFARAVVGGPCFDAVRSEAHEG